MSVEKVDKEELADQLTQYVINGGEGSVDRTARAYKAIRIRIRGILERLDEIRNREKIEAMFL